MFASVNARAGWSRPKAQTHPESQGNVVAGDTESLISRNNRSLGQRRVQNLVAILHLSLLRRDEKRALRAFSLLLRCEKYGCTLRTLWELGLEVLMRLPETSKVKAEEFLGRVRLTSSDVGRHTTTQKTVQIIPL